MTTELQDAGPLGSESSEAIIPSKPKHPYRFNKDEAIDGRYKVIAPLGLGGFAEVYHCSDTRLRRAVAVKVLTEKGLGLEEAQTAAPLKHPNIVEVYDVSETSDGTPFIVFGYVKGETLEKRLNQAQYRRLPLDKDSLHIVHQVSNALDYAHEQDVIHRDVKPSNIILDVQGKAYLTDFGLAEMKRPAQGESMLSMEVRQRLSGTIPYMAPELFEEESKVGDERSDLYSLGVVVYEMLTGQLPYRGRDAALIFQIATSDPTPPTLANPELPEGIEPVLLRALDKDPEERYPSCRAFAAELKDAAQAYVAASDQYEQAREFFEAKQCRQALTTFEMLENQAPGFKDTAHYLEQSRHQVRLLELYEKSQQALEQGEYHDALDTLNVLTQLAPDYEVEEIRRQAREGLAQEEKRSLDEQYQLAVKQFRNEGYKACLDTLAVIRKRDPNYLDPEGIEAPAREHVERQQRLRALYSRGVEQMGREQWQEALDTFQALDEDAPGYEDVEVRLAMVRHLARLSLLFREAKTYLEEEKSADCMDKLDELQWVDDNYKQEEVAWLRKEVLNRLFARAQRLLKEKRFEESLTALAELWELSPDYSGLEELAAQDREGIRIRNLTAKLDSLYQQAVKHVEQRSYREAFQLWQTIQRQREDLDYSDEQNVESQARNGLCMSLYHQALVALNRRDPQRALELWAEVRTVDPQYPDDQRVEQQARALDLYHQALAALNQKEPQRALELLDQAQAVDPSYPDSQQVQQQARAMNLYLQAQEALDRGEPHRALEMWDQVCEVDLRYPDDERVEQGAQAMSLYHRALEALDQEAPQRALSLWRQVCEVAPQYPDDERVEQRAQAMSLYHQALAALGRGQPQQALKLWERVHEVDSKYVDRQRVEQEARAMILYLQAQEAVARREPLRALELWAQVHKMAPQYPDDQRVEQRAQALGLYHQAIRALNQKAPRQALGLWRQVLDVDPNYSDSQRVREQAQAMVKRQERIQKVRQFAVPIGGGAVALLCMGVFAASIISGRIFPGVFPWSRATPTPTATPTLTPSPTGTPRVTSSPTVMSTRASTVPVTLTPTLLPAPSPLPTSTVPISATAVIGSGIFAAPDADSQVLGGVSEGEQVRVLGRSAYGQWFYVRDDQRVEGFVYAPRFEWEGDYESLPVIAAPITPGPVTQPTPSGPPYSTPTIDLWDISGRCSGGKSYKSVFIHAHGGNGIYTYYWNGSKVAGPTSESYTFEVETTGGPVIGTGKVISGDGQVVERELFIKPPDCAK